MERTSRVTAPSGSDSEGSPAQCEPPGRGLALSPGAGAVSFLRHPLRSRKFCRRFRNERRLLRGKYKGQDGPSSIALFTVERAASRYVANLMRALALDAGMTPIDLDSYFFELGKVQEWLGSGRSVPPGTFRDRGYCYGPFRTSYPRLFDGDRLRFLLALRDPRDALVSLYFSYCYEPSRPLLADDRFTEEGEAKRRRFRSQSVDEFVTMAFTSWRHIRKSYRDYCDHLLGKSNVLFVRYEDMVEDFDRWLESVVEFFEFRPAPELLAGIRATAGFPVSGERVDAQKRQVLPGDHKRKLAPETVDTLTRECEDILVRLGYAP